jgi:hypothetical protein
VRTTGSMTEAVEYLGICADHRDKAA